MEKRKTRSSAYQWILLETVCSNDMMEAFGNEDSIYNRLNPFHYNEDLMELEDQLKVEFWRVVNDNLTERQRDVLKLLSEGLTQSEVGSKLGVNQSSITKNLHGNTSTDLTVYGGSKKKLRKIIEGDDRIQAILEKIRELRIEKW